MFLWGFYNLQKGHALTQSVRWKTACTAVYPWLNLLKCAASHVDIMLSQAAVEQREKAERGYLTINSWHLLWEADLLFRGHDRWQTTDDKGGFQRKSSKILQRCNLSVKYTTVMPQS